MEVWSPTRTPNQNLGIDAIRAPSCLRKVLAMISWRGGKKKKKKKKCAHLTTPCQCLSMTPPGGRVLPLSTPDFTLRIVSLLGPSTPRKQGDSVGANLESRPSPSADRSLLFTRLGQMRRRSQSLSP
ncbi:hypothetical protein LZ31DRAFT_202855 [Colletotrichum somersetense]|nr:hypothetical protein LZ31DRAFT_202855 [Colletotrichum somersetense]